MTPRELDGRRLALALWAEASGGEDDVVVIWGQVQVDSEGASLDRGGGQKPFPLRDEWFHRARAVAEDVRDVFSDAEFVISLAVGDLPGGADASEFEHTGLKWPE